MTIVAGIVMSHFNHDFRHYDEGRCPDSWRSFFDANYNPRHLPSCIVYESDADASYHPRWAGLEQRERSSSQGVGECLFKVWDYPMWDGELFYSKYLNII
jgi:hypothetical protein